MFCYLNVVGLLLYVCIGPYKTNSHKNVLYTYKVSSFYTLQQNICIQGNGTMLLFMKMGTLCFEIPNLNYVYAAKFPDDRFYTFSENTMRNIIEPRQAFQLTASYYFDLVI